MNTHRARRMSAILAVSVLFTFALLLRSGGGSAAETPLDADLEHGFWVCDYVATTHGIDATPATLCSTITDELKSRKFGGDFEALVEWWRENKVVEHRKLEFISQR